ncbi:MAG: HAD family hydrolase, partial [Oscillospiraceae bacterium]|nr:HAD family hydrolase [Oscillospiraceae bacterium]
MTGNIGNMSRAVFLDRDGVVNEDGGYIYKREDFRFLNGIFDFCRAARARGYLLFIITNQAGIARGYFTEEDYRALTEWMLDKFAEQGIQIKKVYHCPYHPEHGVGRYKKDSFDRKPNPGMIFRAQREFNINLWSSVLIGDKDSDINA